MSEPAVGQRRTSAAIRGRITERLKSGQVVDSRLIAEAEGIPAPVADYNLGVLEQEGSTEIAETRCDDDGRLVKRFRLRAEDP
ncbi:MAG: hypothetical protein H0X42_14240 [Solirubrobacterales bacterium]|nr:hypothetical protein [Solirubrobacterales bacterium]